MNSNKLSAILNVTRLGLAALGVIACILIISGPNGAGDVPKEQVEAFRDGGKMAFAISYTGILMFACLAVVLLFFIYQLVTNPKKTIMSIIGIIAVFALYFILMAVGSSDKPEDINAAVAVPVTQGTVNSTTAGIWTVIIALGVTFFAALAGPLYARFKK